MGWKSIAGRCRGLFVASTWCTNEANYTNDDDDGDMDDKIICSAIQLILCCLSAFIWESVFQGATKRAHLTECGVLVYLSRTWRLGGVVD